MKVGVYYNPKKNTLARVERNNQSKRNDAFIIYKGKNKPHPILRTRYLVYEELTGEYFFNKSMKNFEYIGEFE